MARPLGDEHLWSEIEEIRSAGVDVLVSMLEREELPVLGLMDEELAAPVSGLRFFHLPTPDQGAPSSSQDTLQILSQLAEMVSAGGHVAVHCRGGVGRSPAFAAGILVMAGFSAEAAMATLSRERGKPVPDHSVQRAWVRHLELGRE